MKRMRWWMAPGLVCLASCGGEDPGPEVQSLTIRTTSLSAVRLNDNYDSRIELTGGTPPYAVKVVEGALPSGVELRETTAQLIGVATTPGHARFTVEASDTGGRTARQMYDVFVIPEALQIVTASLPMGREGTAYDHLLVGSGGVPPLTWSIGSGALPAGLSITEDRISGTPSASGPFSLVLVLKDAEGTARQQPVTLTIAGLDPMISTTTLPKARENAPYDADLLADGGTPPYSWNVTAGALPNGMDLAIDGHLGGTPDAAGSVTFTVRVTDAASRTDDIELTLEVIAPLQLVTTALSPAIIDRPYSFTFAASGGEPPYAWSLAPSDVLPAGLTFSTDGVLSGTTNAMGETDLTVRVRDAEGFQRSGLFTLRVSDRYVYEVATPTPFPGSCTSSVAWVSVPIPVSDSFQVADVNVSVESTYGASNQRLRYLLVSPDHVPVVLCGDGVGFGTNGTPTIPAGELCGGAGGVDKDWDDEGAQVQEPERPLAGFDGYNPQGTWELRIAVARPSCTVNGTIDRVTLSIQADRATEDYVVIKGFNKNNMLQDPFVRLQGGGVAEHDLFLSATAYSVGANGIREGGKGDDVADPTPLVWSISGAPQGTGVTPDGHVTAPNANRTGTGQLTASGGGHSASIPIHVSPPDWNPVSRAY
jgi:hypothetical protein